MEMIIPLPGWPSRRSGAGDEIAKIRPVKLLLFDLDGTLLSTGGAGVRALDRAFLSLLRLPRASDGVSFAGRTDKSIMREIFRTRLGREPDPRELETIAEHYLTGLEAELADAEGYRVLEGVLALLESLEARDDVFLALGTGNLEKGARLKLAPAGLNRFFSAGGYGSDAEDRPDVLRAGVDRSARAAGRGFSGRDVVVVGDTVHDVTAGKAIGAFTVAVAAGHGTPEELRAAAPDILIPSLLDPSPLIRLLG
jgi:phosphoglycolate phosphatase